MVCFFRIFVPAIQTTDMTYSETLDYLYSRMPVFQRDGASAYKPGLDNILKLDERYDRPHQKFQSIHVAGTNGKGSVSHLIASILQESGYKVGLYTSPHLKDFRERIRINGNPIPEENVVVFAEQYRDHFSNAFEPSFFELTTELAFRWFADEDVQVAIIETGLGGRLDSTNIIHPEATVITNIGFDHTALLGDTLEKIAYEKAGIIKKGVPVIVGEAQGSVLHVFETTSREHSSPIHLAEREFITSCQTTPEGCKIHICEGSIKDYKPLICALGGWYQRANAATVLSLIEVLKNKGFSLDEKAVREGFKNVVKNTHLRGRWEILCETPKIICDTGHNEAGIRAVVEQLTHIPYDTLHIVLGMVNDKDIRSVLALLPKKAQYYFTKASIPRALPENSLAEMAHKFGLFGRSYPTVFMALESAKKNSRPNDLIFVGGSTFVVAEVI